ncbi:hypothetical protein L2E82_47345 [Cichorium intybus]|uniref:Uncharacterized protein n=1 Tax=Cichorium intybus TaxID=13427 RepID=A0ACB8YVJ7_CICIN|nr:hypothetical protein L2E82_47345 [Cichorium intybus]
MVAEWGQTSETGLQETSRILCANTITDDKKNGLGATLAVKFSHDIKRVGAQMEENGQELNTAVPAGEELYLNETRPCVIGKIYEHPIAAEYASQHAKEKHKNRSRADSLQPDKKKDVKTLVQKLKECCTWIAS